MKRLPSIKEIVASLIVFTVVSVLGILLHSNASSDTQNISSVHLPLINGTPHSTSGYPIVFVSRQIPPNGSIYLPSANDMPGVGPYSRFRVAAPGKLLVLEPNGAIRVLIDGTNPGSNAFNLIDVNAPDVSYDGNKIVFAGLPDGNYSPNPMNNPGAWRLFIINVDGAGLQKITFSDQSGLDLSQFGPAADDFQKYDDTDPVWLPDGRIVFSSTRWPSYSQYSGARTSNLFVVNANGNNLHRITSERNGADRPLVEPITGKIVYSRWWRNHRFAVDSMATIPDPNGGYIQNNGLTVDRSTQVGGFDNLWRNHWQIATINPDGTELALWNGVLRSELDNTYYGGAFTPSGSLIANFFPMFNMSEAAGFGGLRRYTAGTEPYEPIIGITDLSGQPVVSTPPISYGVYIGIYAGEPEILPNGNILFSKAEDPDQDYGLYIVDANGNNEIALYDNVGTTELRARLIRPRPLPPIIPDVVTQVASPLPPLAGGPYDTDGTFIFDALNVYFNAPVDVDIINAPAVGSADIIRFFIDHQRTSSGSFPALDWPILLEEIAVNPDGSVQSQNAPANVPLFEQLRSSDGTVPVTTNAAWVNNEYVDGAAHVAGMNFGRPGTTVTCVGCHAGHTLIPVPTDPEAARWTNLAPGASISVSSSRDPQYNISVADRRVMKGELWRYWTSAANQTQNQWVELTFSVPVTIRTIRLYNPRFEAGCNLQVHNTTVRLYSDAAGTIEVAQQQSGALQVAGTDLTFPEVTARVVRIELNSVSGTFFGMNVAGLAEVEVIARAEPLP